MDEINMKAIEDMNPDGRPVGPQRLREWMQILERYCSGRKRTADRILSAENWWKLRNTMEAQKVSQIGADGGMTSQSGWLHNVITSKHADAMDAFPAPVMLPREERDKAEAEMLTDILPCILEANGFEETYSDAMWQKTKTGTAAYKVIWDSSKLNGLGDISITRVNLLNLYWQPEITDIQKSRYLFQTEIVARDVLEEQYPELKGKLKGNAFIQTRFLGDEYANDQADTVTVIEIYYHKTVGGKNTLQYCKFVADQVIYATENETEATYDDLGNPIEAPVAFSGLYDHGLYPFVFDTLFPVEGSPCGYGYVDVCRNPQTVVDILKTAMVKNAAVGAVPRYFSRLDGNISEQEFLDLSKPIVHVSGNLDDASLRLIQTNSLPGNYLNLVQDTVQELRETSGNTEASTGTAPSGVTAASALAALQEASGKGSRDSSRGSYRAFRRIINLCVELIRQFYDLPRQFRITGKTGQEQFVTYTNENLVMQKQPDAFGEDMGARLPVFDIKIIAQKKNAYTTMAQNELAIQLFQMGVFQPQMADSALMMLDMMEFDGKDELIGKIQQKAIMQQMLIKYLQASYVMASQLGDQTALQEISMDMQVAQQMGMGIAAPPQMGMGQPQVQQPQAAQRAAVNPDEGSAAGREPAHMEKAREHTAAVTQP